MARIILADDDPIIGDLVSMHLTRCGHVVGVVTTGNDALKACWTKRPDMMILDCGMPDMSGILVLRQIRITPEIAETPILMLTGRRSQSDENIAMHAGANDYLTKPFDLHELAFRVEDLLALNARRVAKNSA